MCNTSCVILLKLNTTYIKNYILTGMVLFGLDSAYGKKTLNQ